jgi:hypothetical protein
MDKQLSLSQSRKDKTMELKKYTQPTGETFIPVLAQFQDENSGAFDGHPAGKSEITVMMQAVKRFWYLNDTAQDDPELTRIMGEIRDLEEIDTFDGGPGCAREGATSEAWENFEADHDHNFAPVVDRAISRIKELGIY